jgi:hypothetical protein
MKTKSRAKKRQGFGSPDRVHIHNAEQENKRAAKAALDAVRATQAGDCRAALSALHKAIRHGAMAEAEAYSQTQDPKLESRVRSTGGGVLAATETFEMHCVRGRKDLAAPRRKRASR